MKTYDFALSATSITAGLERRKAFEAETLLAALQLASNYWFAGKKVKRYRRNTNGEITLFSSETFIIGVIKIFSE